MMDRKALITMGYKYPLIMIYEHPEDYPDCYVARVFNEDKPTNICAIAKTYEELREKWCLSGWAMVSNHRDDDPSVYEIWA